ncbi:hypothetical protein KTO58_15005 [Chitinophaga pendula]|uniref:hypothetical protein n=1 Tax=Chitinophaga pendula TaxID=2849666 RepID=UPI001CECDBE4|nr:hypothetical protein [Chitinophaga pendula]UCJ05006.1 hypothetical protein KTO58_15005 [Chitinophaga pendula]
MFLKWLLLISTIGTTANTGLHNTQDTDFSGTYQYEMKNTPYGDFMGKIILKKEKETYRIEVVNNKGEQFSARIIRLKGNRIVMATNFEYADATLYGYFRENALSARIEAKGDPFLYKFIARK